MSVARITCPACAAPVEVVAEQEYSRCPFCRSTLKVESAAHSANREIGATLAKETNATRSEIQRMQLLQELGLLKARLAGAQGEIRTLEREKATPVTRRQLVEVQGERDAILQEIDRLNARIAPSTQSNLGYAPNRTTETRPAWQRLLTLFFVPFGRLSRAHFAAGLGVLIGISVLLSPFYQDGESAQGADSGGGGVIGMLTLILIFAYASLAIKRYHDIDKSGWWFFIALIPFGIFYQWYQLLVSPGTEGANQYGAKPSQKIGDLLPIRDGAPINQSPG
jgi:uncharacterized membrane protein YhaH (DUF805 family)